MDAKRNETTSLRALQTSAVNRVVLRYEWGRFIFPPIQMDHRFNPANSSWDFSAGRRKRPARRGCYSSQRPAYLGLIIFFTSKPRACFLIPEGGRPGRCQAGGLGAFNRFDNGWDALVAAPEDGRTPQSFLYQHPRQLT